MPEPTIEATAISENGRSSATDSKVSSSSSVDVLKQAAGTGQSKKKNKKKKKKKNAAKNDTEEANQEPLVSSESSLALANDPEMNVDSEDTPPDGQVEDETKFHDVDSEPVSPHDVTRPQEPAVTTSDIVTNSKKEEATGSADTTSSSIDSSNTSIKIASRTPLASPGLEKVIEFPKVRKSSERSIDEPISPGIGSYSPIHLESPRFSAGRSRASTAGSIDSKASGTIDDKSYFNGPEDKLVSRLVSNFEKFSDAANEDNALKQKPRRNTSGKKKLDTSFLNKDATIPTSRSSPALHSPPGLLRKSSSEYFRKLAQASDAPPPMPDLSSVNPWSTALSSAKSSTTSLHIVEKPDDNEDIEKDAEKAYGKTNGKVGDKPVSETFSKKSTDKYTEALANENPKTGSPGLEKGINIKESLPKEESPNMSSQTKPKVTPIPKRATTERTTPESEDGVNDDDFIFGVCVVGFHHAGGPQVEYWIGPHEDQSGLWPFLAFQSLPDGSHTHEENFCYFTLLYDEEKKIAPNPTPSRNEEGHIVEQSDFKSVTTLFGISCNRQIRSDEIKNVTSDITRSTVQKSVVIIARKPIFGPIKDKLAIVTRAYFNQGDFQDTVIIDSLYNSLKLGFNRPITDSDLIVGMPLRELIKRLGHQVLVLLKALLLEKRILFFASNSELLCSSQFALVSLIPNLINHLEDCGSPLLSTYETTLQKPTSLKTSDRGSLMTYMGLPLQVFAAGGIFSPYVPLQQLSELEADETKYFLVGTTNSLIMTTSSIKTDVVVDMDRDIITIHDEKNRPDKTHTEKHLSSLLTLSRADRKWIDNIVKAVDETWDSEDPLRPSTNGFYGSEDFIRMQFEDYMLHMLASVKYDEFLANGGKLPPVHKRDNMIKLYNMDWINEWKYTNNYRIFNNFTDSDLFDIVTPKHLGESPFGISTILNGSGLPPDDNSQNKGVAKLFGNIWGQRSSSASNNEGKTEDNSGNRGGNRISMASLKNTLSDLRSNSSSTISFDQKDQHNQTGSTIAEDLSTSAHQSQTSLVSNSSHSTQISSSSAEEKKPSKAASYFASWSTWANSKRAPKTDKPDEGEQVEEVKNDDAIKKQIDGDDDSQTTTK